MAAALDSVYFPSLDRCLAGHDRLISWKTAYHALRDEDAAVDNVVLEEFLEDKKSLNILSSALEPFQNPGASARNDFETKTAPIHVSQSANSNYDLEQIKRDALWLSDELKAEELVALRVAILEWQQRDADQLLASTVANNAVVAGTNGFAASLLRSTNDFSETANGVVKPVLDFSREDVRRQRMIRFYFEEREYLLKLSADLVSRCALDEHSSLISRSGTWLQSLATQVTEHQCTLNDYQKNEAFCLECIAYIQKRRKGLSDPAEWPKFIDTYPETGAMYFASFMQNIATVMRLLLSQVYGLDRSPSSELVLAWFEAMDQFAFCQDLQAGEGIFIASTIQSLAAVTSLAMLQVHRAIALQQDQAIAERDGITYPQIGEKPYCLSDSCLESLNTIFFHAAERGLIAASPAIYAWSLLTLHIRDLATDLKTVRLQQADDGIEYREDSRVRSISDSRPTALEDRYRKLQDPKMGEAGDDPPTFFAQMAVDGMNVYGLISVLSGELTSTLDSIFAAIGRQILYSLLREGFELVSYGDEVVEALLALLAPETSRHWATTPTLSNDFFTDNERMKPHVLNQALARYPYELSPLLRIFTALVAAQNEDRVGPPAAVQILENLRSFAIMVPEHFRSYQLENEDENANAIVLTQDLYVFKPKQPSLLTPHRMIAGAAMPNCGDDEASSVLVIRAGTPGFVIREERPMVLRLDHSHSALEFLGLLLSTLLPNSDVVPASLSAGLDRQSAAETILLINALLTESIKQHQGIEEARFVLGRLSYALPEEQDIISTITDIFEMELLAHLDQAAQESSLELVIACADFFDVLINISPERVWPVLARSSLLGAGGGASALTAVAGGIEEQAAQFQFLAVCARTYSHLIDDAISGLVRRMATQARTTNRFDSPMQQPDSTPQRTMSGVLVAYQRVMLEVFQLMAGWRFAMRTQKWDVATTMVAAFNTLLRATYGLEAPVDEKQEKKERITAVLMQAADMVLQAFVPEDGSAHIDRIIGLLTEDVVNIDDLQSRSRLVAIKQVQVLCNFLIMLLRTGRAFDPSRVLRLSTKLLKNIPNFAMLFGIDHALKASISTLLSEIVFAVAADDTNPPSMLAALDQRVAKAFVAVVTQLDRPLRDQEVEIEIWNLLSAVLRGRQHWFAIYLLTGTLPKTRLQDHTCRSRDRKTKSLLTHALDELSNISVLNPERAKAMLKFVAAAQIVWIWTTNEVQSHPEFLKNALSWLEKLNAPKKASNNTQSLISAHEHRMAAYMCDILATSLLTGLETDDRTLLKLLVTKMDFLCKHAVNVNAYNRSLHANLAENLSKKYPQCDMSDFKRTYASPAPYGREFYYDLEVPGSILGHDVAWSGAQNGRGFVDEFVRANVNLSLVDAQTHLLASWKTLTTTLSECVDQDQALPPVLATCAKACLCANGDAHMDEPGTINALEARAEVAFVLMSKLISFKCSDPVLKELLPAAWDLVRTSPADYDVATAPEGFQYYRALLQILYLALQPHVYMEPPPSAVTAACLADIVRKTIAPGFRALCGNLHEDLQLAQPGDFALLTALMQGVLAVKNVSAVRVQIAEEVARSNVVRGALSLYSWSDQLAEIMDNDPIYGEVAVAFLLTLSNIPAVAEQMAVDGVLVQLSNANLSNYFRKPNGKGPFDEPKRMFVIWTQGFLPLCINLLDTVGLQMVDDVATFLNSFGDQMARAEKELETEIPGLRRKL